MCTDDNFHMNLVFSAGWMSNGARLENAMDPTMTSTTVRWEGTRVYQTVWYVQCVWGCLYLRVLLVFAGSQRSSEQALWGAARGGALHISL